MIPYRLGLDRLTVEWVHRIALRECAVELDAVVVTPRLQRSHEVILDAIREAKPLYGVTTGFGASCETRVSTAQAAALARNLPRYHGIGVFEPLSDEDVRAVIIARAASLARGHSGVRPVVVERLVELLRFDLLPIIPSRGSVGASGDLTPLSYVASSLVGERRARLRGETMPTREALRRVGLEPLELGPKESLALMNGTSVMAGTTARSCARARRLAELACAATALASHAMDGQAAHFDERIFRAKPHPGTMRAADSIRAVLGVGNHPRLHDRRIQDRYSIRCAPHVVGVLFDALEFAGRMVEIELDGVSDNPLVDPETGDCLHGGNFYGGHVGFAADALKQAVASVAELLERQIVLLNGETTNGGLPTNLVATKGPEREASHGFKALEITASALVAETLKMATPACLYSRSTEGHNQDKVSMGSIAALELSRVLDLAETVLALHLLASVQGVELRSAERSPAIEAWVGRVRACAEPVSFDRPLDDDAAAIVDLVSRLDPFALEVSS